MKTISIIADFESSGGIRTYFKQLIAFFTQNYTSFNISKIYVFLNPSQNDSEVKKILSGCPFFEPVIFPAILQFNIINKVFRKLGLLDWYEFVIEKIKVNRVLKFKPDAMIFSIDNGTRYFYALTKDVPSLFISHTMMLSSPCLKKNRDRIYKKFKLNCNPKSRLCAVSQIAKSRYDEYMPLDPAAKLYKVLTNHGGSISETVKMQKHKPLCVLTLGLLASFKNPDLWVKVAKNITDKYVKSKKEPPVFIWAGEGTYYDRLVADVVDYKNITFVGFQSDTNHLYEQADIYVQPSTIENCCLSVIEAMKYSLPCVVSDVGGLPEQIQNDYNGYLCQFDDEKAFESAIMTLLENSRKRKSLGKNARKTFEDNYTVEIWNKNFSELVNTVLS